MSKVRVQSSTVEEKFVFGSPPLFNGFTYNTCRSQEGTYTSSHDSSYQNPSQPSVSNETRTSAGNIASSSQSLNMHGHNETNFKNGYSRSCFSNYPVTRNGYHNGGNSLVENFNHLSLNGLRTSHVDNGIRILKQAGIKVQKYTNNEPVFKKRKDLRVLKSVLSNERFRQVVMKFGDGDEGGREIIESVHKTMRSSNLATVSCLFCASESQVYENFPVVDGTLFLTPVRLSENCVKFCEQNSETTQRYMGYICVRCMEGKPASLKCSSCSTPWNGSFFQIGTLYSYNILSAIPCCEQRLSCKHCHETIINIANGEASTLYFSFFSNLSKCPCCQNEDYHFVKPLSTITG
ncbi:headcase protein homolog [Hydractinia symbiolongicarpus]|uniref:headcase protein homolog n=1 Tax=Hydractinia symbiolongicarpus TaxID=13093 RepID=UPI00254EEE36|nr:headcase protein homolog [Hydractinia symbiolongicarpus]